MESAHILAKQWGILMIKLSTSIRWARSTILPNLVRVRAVLTVLEIGAIKAAAMVKHDEKWNGTEFWPKSMSVRHQEKDNTRSATLRVQIDMAWHDPPMSSRDDVKVVWKNNPVQTLMFLLYHSEWARKEICRDLVWSMKNTPEYLFSRSFLVVIEKHPFPW